ncbi:MAG: MarR family transcriptional regulator [Geminicoccaceae bacterium]|nr:MarR family transcriptional regulator [Geminicoccaceae bacterium]
MPVPDARNPLFLREEALDSSLELLTLAHLEMTVVIRPALARARLQASDVVTLSLLARHPGLTMADLARLSGTSKQNLSRHVAVLIDRGLIVAAADRRDRRRRRLSVTEAALDLLQEVVRLQRRQLVRAFRRVGGDAVEGFTQVMRELVQPSSALLERAAERGPAISPCRPSDERDR